MKTLLYDKPSLHSIWAFLFTKSGTIFTKITGYDLMFEASRKDIKITDIISEDVLQGNEDDNVSRFSWPR
jgi:hypothetical protein